MIHVLSVNQGYTSAVACHKRIEALANFVDLNYSANLRGKMNSIPIAIELISGNGYGPFFSFKVYSLDKTSVVIEGGLDKIQKYYNEIKEVRDLPNTISSLIANAQEIKLKIDSNLSHLTEQSEVLPNLEKLHQKRLEQVKSENPILDYEKRLAETMTSSHKKGSLVACGVVATLGIMIFFSGYGGFRKFLGGSVFLGGGLCQGNRI